MNKTAPQAGQVLRKRNYMLSVANETVSIARFPPRMNAATALAHSPRFSCLSQAYSLPGWPLLAALVPASLAGSV